MSYADGLIPTLEPGQRVRVTPRANPEDVCPNCGAENNVTDGQHEVIILSLIREDESIWCNLCETAIPASPGLYEVMRDSGEIGCAPWTWLTPIEDES